MRIGIDIDDTITKTYEKVLDYLEYEATAMTYNELDLVLTDEAVDFVHAHLEDVQRECELKENVKEVLDYLRSKGHQIIFITARGTEMEFDHETITKEYLERNNISYDGLIFKSYNKGKDANDNNIDLFIDDREFNLDSVNEQGIECIKFESVPEPTSKYPMFNNWLDIKEYIDRKAVNGQNNNK